MIRAVLLGLVLAGCAAHGPPESAVQQRLVWFSYVVGEDIRADCAVGGPDHLRFVFNADFNREVRTVDVWSGGAGGTLASRRFYGSNVVRIGAAGLLNLPDGHDEGLTAAAMEDLRRARDGALAAPPRSMILRSHEHYGILAACTGGDFALRGYHGNELEESNLFNTLGSLDPAGETWPAPDPRTRRPPSRAETRDWHEPYFVIRFDAAGHATVSGS